MIILNGAYRPFFPAAGLLAACAIPLWLGYYAGLDAFGPDDMLRWHMHEMLFGYLGGVLAGFLLTAIPNWTGRPAIKGRPLLLLFLAWLLGRFVFLATPDFEWAALIFPVALAGIASFEIVAGGNKRNLVMAALVWIFVVAQIVMIWDDPWFAQRMGLAIAGCMIALIGGRITPTFSRNWLKAKGLDHPQPQFGMVDRAALITTVITLIAWVAIPTHPITGGLAIFAAVSLGVRLCRWRADRVVQEPLLFALHAAYAWLVLSFALLAGHVLGDWFTSAQVSHAFGAGAVGTMTLVVMLRALLGHSGRPVTANGLDILALVMVHTGALLRILAGSVDVPALLFVSGTIWSLGFLTFTLRAIPLAKAETP